MKKIFGIVLALLLIHQSAFTAVSAECSNDKGKLSKCNLEAKNGSLIVTYKKKLSSLDKNIPGKKITNLSSGEYSRRRVAESLAVGLLLTPWALFGLFSKKQMESFGVEYINPQGHKDAFLIMVKNKYGMAVKTLLQSVSGKKVEMDPARTKKKIDVGI